MRKKLYARALCPKAYTEALGGKRISKSRKGILVGRGVLCSGERRFYGKTGGFDAIHKVSKEKSKVVSEPSFRVIFINLGPYPLKL